MNGDAAGDQHEGQARDQPPTDRIAAIRIAATADDVEGRPVRHKLNVPAPYRRERAAGALVAAEVRRNDTGGVSRADAVAALVTVWLALAVLTAVGARQRGRAWAAALASGLLFPVTWVMWYLTDTRPERKARG